MLNKFTGKKKGDDGQLEFSDSLGQFWPIEKCSRMVCGSLQWLTLAILGHSMLDIIFCFMFLSQGDISY